MTSARSPYYFSLHADDPGDPDGGSRKDTGHTLICGPTGSGKTVFIGFMIAMLARQGATQVVFDKDRGLEILVRALGGEYFPLKNGVPTGFNPLQLPATRRQRGISQELAPGAVLRSRRRRPHANSVREPPISIRRCAVPWLWMPRPAGCRAGGIPRSHRPDGLACAPIPLVRVLPRRLCVGVR
jgi:hypothetical protein